MIVTKEQNGRCLDTGSTPVWSTNTIGYEKWNLGCGDYSMTPMSVKAELSDEYGIKVDEAV